MRKPEPFSDEQFKWYAMDAYGFEFKCCIDDYTMLVNYHFRLCEWDCRVFFKNQEIHRHRQNSDSQMRAIGHCEGFYIGISLSNKIDCKSKL